MTNPFSRRTLFIIIGVVAVSLAAAVALTVMNPDDDTNSAGAHGYSTSAIGHRGLVQILQKLDIPVVVSRSDSARKAKDGLLVIAEPIVTDDSARARLRKLLQAEATILLVLPKWYGQAERGSTYVEDVDLIPEQEIAPVFDVLGAKAEVVRLPMPTVFTGENPVGMPKIREPQLVRSDELHQIITDSEGNVLFGTFDLDGTEIFVLSDPDVLNNYGLRTVDNARFIVTEIDTLRSGGPVVLDEVTHGYAQQPSLLRTLFRFPLVLATMQVLVCALLAVWAAMVRFGPRRGSAQPIGPGKDFLIRNTAALLQYGGHHKHALARYLQLTIGEVRRALHAPMLAPHETVAWLERVRQVRKGKISLRDLELAVESATTPQRVVDVADEVFRWRMEMTHGIDNRS